MRKTVLALVILLTLSCVFVVGVSMSKVAAQTVQSLASQQLFNADLLYAYVKPGVHYATVVLTFTQVSYLALPSNTGITDVYTAQVYSNGQVLMMKEPLGVSNRR